MPRDATYTIADLARLTGLNVRTIRYYIAQGLIPSSGEAGPGAHYVEGHLDRLRLTKRLQAQHLPLSVIRRRLAELADADVAGLLAAADAQQPVRDASALEYVRGVLAGRPSTDLARDSMPIGASPRPPAPPLASRPSPNVPPPRFDLRSALKAGIAPKAQRKIDANESARTLSLAEVPFPAGTGSDRPAEPPTEGPVRAQDRREFKPPERSQWERLSLGPNIELHVRRPLSRLEQRRVERLITIARQVLNEDQS